MKNEASFSAFFNGHIWRIFPDTDFQVLVLEIRNYEAREVSFAAVDLIEKGLIWQDFKLSEPWWTGIETVKNGHILFHGYNHIQYANHLGISCMSIANQQIIWERKDFIFKSISQNHIIVSHRKETLFTKFLQINFFSGEIMSEFEGQVGFELDTPSSVLYPLKFESDDSAFSKVLTFLEKKMQLKAVFTVEYLEYNECIIISFYIKEGDKLQNRLILLDNNANLLHDWLLAENLTGIGTQTFLVINNRLIFVQHSNELKIYEL